MKFLKRFLVTAALFYLLICGLVYFFQEKIIFHPAKLEQAYAFRFNQKFKERSVRTFDNQKLNALFFPADKAKGLIFLLHGNAGNLQRIGGVAKTYTDLHFDVFIFDYRGFGKSDGRIQSELQLYQDVSAAYESIKDEYDENKIIVLGYSIGTGLAAKIASVNKPSLLILEAPYYNLTDLMKRKYPFLPGFLLKYKFETNQFLKLCKMPIYIFHGTEDKSTFFDSSVKLKTEFKDKIHFIPLEKQGHNGISNHPKYQIELQKILKRKS